MPKKTTSTGTKKKVAAKPAAKKTAKAPASKKVAVAKSPAKKVAKKPVAKKKAAVKSAAKTKKRASVTTTIVARVDVGFGNDLYIRGEGDGLSWDKGSLMENASPYEWTFTSKSAAGSLSFKFLINDELWAEGENLTVTCGSESVSSPTFIS